MLEYLLKSGACLAILFLFYKLFLEKESMHVFKRYYLLGALAIALLIPAIVFTEYVEIPAPTTIYAPTQPVTTTNDVIGVAPALEADVLDIEPLLWTAYFLGMLFFGIKFIRNLFQIFRRIRSNPKQRLARFTQVLLQEKLPPHTFFSYIFLNREKLEANEIPQEVLLHEETHAEQKHSWDVVFVELLHVILWVNPFVYLTKKAIKLNHEFLADRAVLNNAFDQSTYQNTLLSYLSSDSHKKYQPSLPNAINYSSIKKRFTVMKKQTSKKGILLRSLMLLPLLAILLYGFSETRTLQKQVTHDPAIEINERTILNDANLKSGFNEKQPSNRSVELAGLILDSETLLPLENVEIFDVAGSLLSKTDERGYYKVLFDRLNQAGEIEFNFSLRKDGYNPLEQKEHWGDYQGKIESAFYFGLKKNGSESLQFTELVTNPSNLNYESILNNSYKIKTNFEFEKKIENLKKGNQLVFFEIENEYYLINKSSWIKIHSEDDLISINDNQIIHASEVNNIIKRQKITGMTPIDPVVNNSALFAIYTIPVDHAVKPQKGATQKQLSEFNSIIKRVNLETKSRRIYKQIEVERLKYIYSLMTERQREEAETFPKLVPPPAQDGASRKLMAEYNKLAKHYNEMDSNRMTIKKKDVERLKYIYDLMSDKQRADAEPFPDFPEPPPAPDMPELAEVRELSPQPPTSPLASRGEVANIPSPPSAPNQKSKWAVTAVANRDSRQNAKGTPLPPTAPTIATLVKTDKYSKELKAAIKKYLEKNSIYEEAIAAYKNKGKGNRENLWHIYNETIELYVNYHVIAKKEGNFVQPIPAYKKRSEAKKELISPPPPPAPKAPLDHVIEMAKKGATFYYEEKKVSSDKAIQLLKKNKSLNIETKQHNSKNPQVKISKKPYVHDQSSNLTPASSSNVKTGNIQINGKDHFYSTKNGITSYFNRRGEQVDKKGHLLGPPSKQNPTFYYNGQQISSEKAHRLLSNNTSIQVTNEDVSDTEYAIVLTDLNKVKTHDQNLMNNPNSVIDLTKVISQGAVFFFNDKAITTEKALWLTQNDNMERVQVKEGKDKKPEVYFWKNN